MWFQFVKVRFFWFMAKEMKRKKRKRGISLLVFRQWEKVRMPCCGSPEFRFCELTNGGKDQNLRPCGVKCLVMAGYVAFAPNPAWVAHLPPQGRRSWSFSHWLVCMVLFGLYYVLSQTRAFYGNRYWRLWQGVSLQVVCSVTTSEL